MKLAEWLKDARESDGRQLRRYEFAKRIGVSPVMITEYCAGNAWPSRDVMVAIERETAGAVTANDFVHVQAAE